SSDVVVSVARTSGSSNISVAGGANLTFTSATWNSPQTETRSAPSSGDTANSTATVTVSAAGLTGQAVSVTAIDTNLQSLVLSASSLTFNQGSGGSFAVKLAAQPSSDVILSVARTSGSSNISVTGGANLTFTSLTWNSPQTVTLSAPADSDTSNSMATIVVGGGGVPS